METNWLIVAIGPFVVYTLIAGYFGAKMQWSKTGLLIAGSNMLVVYLNLVAPFRGVMDPDYLGYQYGLIHADPGIGVTLASGLIILIALSSACIALWNKRGGTMKLLALFQVILLSVFGAPTAIQGLMDPSAFKIQLGEYLTVPGLIAVIIITLLFAVPEVLGIVWSIKRMKNKTKD